MACETCRELLLLIEKITPEEIREEIFGGFLSRACAT